MLAAVAGVAAFGAVAVAVVRESGFPAQAATSTVKVASVKKIRKMGSLAEHFSMVVVVIPRRTGTSCRIQAQLRKPPYNSVKS